MIRTGTPSGTLPAAPPRGRASSQNPSELDTSFRELFEFAPVAYHEIDAAGIRRRVNQTEYRILGYSAADTIGNPVSQFLAADQQEQCPHAFARKIAGDEPVPPFARDFLRRDGGDL